ncbi:MAG: tetratricopeptide repeat protein [Burkholderiaceae bacterium]
MTTPLCGRRLDAPRRGGAVALTAWLCTIACAPLLMPSSTHAAPTDDEPETTALDPDYAAGKRAIDAKDWRAAVKALSSAALRDTRNADIQNYLGYAHRNLGDLARAFTHYERALKLNPRHRGAHEYAGEAALLAGDLPRAQRHLSALKGICLLPCEELDDLNAAVEAYLRRGGKSQ